MSDFFWHRKTQETIASRARGNLKVEHKVSVLCLKPYSHCPSIGFAGISDLCNLSSVDLSSSTPLIHPCEPLLTSTSEVS